MNFVYRMGLGVYLPEKAVRFGDRCFGPLMLVGIQRLPKKRIRNTSQQQGGENRYDYIG